MKKNDVWLKYIEMKRNNDKDLPVFLSDPYIKRIINKKDFDVFMGKKSKIYHKQGCGYLSRSRTLLTTSRSNAILQGYVKCNACIKEVSMKEAIIGIFIGIIFAIITVCISIGSQ